MKYNVKLILWITSFVQNKLKIINKILTGLQLIMMFNASQESILMQLVLNRKYQHAMGYICLYKSQNHKFSIILEITYWMFLSKLLFSLTNSKFLLNVLNISEFIYIYSFNYVLSLKSVKKYNNFEFFVLTKIFCGFKSLWKKPWECKHVSAKHV